MKVLLINTNQEHDPWPVIPLGICYVASFLEQHGHQVELLDLCFVHSTARAVHRAIGHFTPDAVGISIRNIDNVNLCHPYCYLDHLRTDVIDVCHSFSGLPLIIGGSAIGIAPEEIMCLLDVDFAVSGDGGGAMLQWLEYLQGGGRDIPANHAFFCRYDDGSVRVPTDCRPEPFLEGLHPRPFRWIDYLAYQRRGATVNVQTKRGCAFQCLYCSYNTIEGRHYRLRQPDDVADEVKTWMEHGYVRGFEFVDSVFNAPLQHAQALCEELIRRKVKTSFTTMGLNPGCLSEELLSVMRRAGFDDFMCSPDSASPLLLENLKKNFNRDDLERASTLFQRYNMRTFWFFILGGPGETRETVLDTLDFCQKAIHPHDIIHITIGFRVFPGTGLEAYLRENGDLGADRRLIQPTFYCSPHISPVDILKLVHDHASRNTNIITYFDMELYDFFRRFNHVLFLGNPPPHSWRQAPVLNVRLSRIGFWDWMHQRHRRRFDRVINTTDFLLAKNSRASL